MFGRRGKRSRSGSRQTRIVSRHRAGDSVLRRCSFQKLQSVHRRPDGSVRAPQNDWPSSRRDAHTLARGVDRNTHGAISTVRGVMSVPTSDVSRSIVQSWTRRSRRWTGARRSTAEPDPLMSWKRSFAQAISLVERRRIDHLPDEGNQFFIGSGSDRASLARCRDRSETNDEADVHRGTGYLPHCAHALML